MNNLIMNEIKGEEVKIVKKNNKKKKGFTLVELIAVIAIIGILAAIIVPNIGGFTTKAKVSKAVADAKTIVSAIDAYNAEQDGASGAAISDEATGLSTDAKIVSSTAAIKTWPKELPTGITLPQLRIVADKGNYRDSGTTTGTWTLDSNGLVAVH